MSYNCTIAVHPTDPNHVICGGVDLHLTTDGGATWSRTTRWDAERGTSKYAHADHHQLVMPASAPGRVYAANDGGLDVSVDGGNRWENRSNGLATNMFYDVDVAQTDVRFFGGGAQDNGTIVTTDGRADTFFEIDGGDGGWIVIDPNEADHVYTSSQFGAITRLRNGHRRDVSPPFREEDSGGIWMVYVTIDPNDSDTVYTGNQRVYRTKNDGLSWDALTPGTRRQPHLGDRSRAGRFQRDLRRHGERRDLPQPGRRDDVERQPHWSRFAGRDGHAHRNASGRRQRRVPDRR